MTACDGRSRAIGCDGVGRFGASALAGLRKLIFRGDEMSEKRYLPEGLVEGCKLLRDVPKDSVISYDDVMLPPNRLADQLRAEQYRVFRGETWLEQRLSDRA